jgi:hypothetical protein
MKHAHFRGAGHAPAMPHVMQPNVSHSSSINAHAQMPAPRAATTCRMPVAARRNEKPGLAPGFFAAVLVVDVDRRTANLDENLVFTHGKCVTALRSH